MVVRVFVLLVVGSQSTVPSAARRCSRHQAQYPARSRGTPQAAQLKILAGATATWGVPRTCPRFAPSYMGAAQLTCSSDFRVPARHRRHADALLRNEVLRHASGNFICRHFS